jgi:hypothetical protein
MRDSTYQTQVPAKQCIITYNYGGTAVRDTLSPEEAAAWINVHGKSSNDTTRPLQEGLKSQLRTEIERCKTIWYAQRDLELGLVDQNDTLTLAEYRAARTAIRVRYRSWLQERSVKVPVLGGNP